jgi:hypothetical protein
MWTIKQIFQQKCVIRNVYIFWEPDSDLFEIDSTHKPYASKIFCNNNNNDNNTDSNNSNGFALIDNGEGPIKRNHCRDIQKYMKILKTMITIQGCEQRAWT